MICYILNLVLFFTNSILLYKYLHVYQLKSYRAIRYFRYFKHKKSLFFVICLIFYIIELFINSLLTKIIFNYIFYVLNLFFIKNLIKSKKTPLKYTKKLIRIEILSILILSIMSFYKDGFLLMMFITPLLPVIANSINFYDKIKSHHFISTAQKKLKNSQTKIIAITGSNGKTSVKNILEKMLSTKFNTQATPASYNTPLGIAKFINEQLKFSTDYLILEYGARKRGDIKKLCKLYGADYGIITSIAPQHLETFKSIENIFLEKSYLSHFLQNKPCVFNMDNLYVLRAYHDKTEQKFGISITAEADIYANYLQFQNFQMNFCLNLNGEKFILNTSLLGEHNITNICLASALAQHLGIDINNIARTIENLQPTPHRLQLLQSHINILDDSYNCSPASAQQALKILKQMPNKKMIVTPGIIEGGKRQFDINFKLGELIADFDYCIIVGETNKEALKSGLKNAGKSCIIKYVKNLEQAKQHFGLLSPNDTLLLLNDLPDDYN